MSDQDPPGHEDGHDQVSYAPPGSPQSGEGGAGKGDDAKDKKPPLYKRPIFWIVFLPLLALIVIGGTLYYLHARKFESTDDAFVDSHIVRIAAQSPGRLTEVADRDNQHVEAGTLLAVVEPFGPETQLAQANANLAQAKAEYGQALAQVDQSVAQRAQAQASARAPIANALKAAQDLARYQSLLKLDANAVAAQQLDQARATARSTAGDARAAQRQIDTAEAQIGVSQSNARASQAAIGAREAQIRQAQVTINDLRLTAPVSGQVVNRQVNVGSYVGPGTQLMAIVPDRVWVTANFKETQLTLMKRGQPVDIRVDAFPSIAFHGHIDSVQRGAGQAFALLPPQNATGNYVKVVQRVPVRIEFDRRDDRDPDWRRYPIGPGMSVTPTVEVR